MPEIEYETVGEQPATTPQAGDKVYLERPGSPGTPHYALYENLVPTEDSGELPVFAGPLAPDDKIVVRNASVTSEEEPEGQDQEAEAVTLGLRHNKDDATTDPGVGDDSADGFTVGSRWTNVTLDRVFKCVDASAGAAVWVKISPSVKRVYKLADETIQSDIVIDSDAELAVALEASKTYRVRVTIFYNIADAAADLSVSILYTGTKTGNVTSVLTHYAAGGTSIGARMLTEVTAEDVFSSLTGRGCIIIEQVLTTATAGTMSLGWAQNTSTAADLTVLKGSYIEREEVAN